MRTTGGIVTAFIGREGRRPRVLLVEDNLALGQMLLWCFEETGARAELAGTCAAAWRLARAVAHDLMLIDADLPDGDGVALAESLAEAYPQTRIALCSGRHGVQERHSGLIAPDAFLIKPVPEHRLAALLADALDGRDQAGDTLESIQE